MDREQALEQLGMKRTTVEIDVGATPLILETGYMAKQAAGSVFVRMGETAVISAVCDGPPREGIDFFPLMVDYREMTYAAGRIPGNFFKREARPSDHETLTSRLTDRPLRPLFPDGYKRQVDCRSYVMSFDQLHEADIVSMNGVSAALHLSKIPWGGPIGAVRIGLIDGALVVNPTVEERTTSDLDLVVAGTVDAITMVEAGANVIPEDKMVEALFLAHENIRKICAAIEDLREQVGQPKLEFEAPAANPWVAKLIDGKRDAILQALRTPTKMARYAAIDACRAEIVAELGGDDPEKAAQVKAAFGPAKDHLFRELILSGTRVDGRDTKTVRPIVIDLDLLPRAHGSALFTRGETQGMLTCTLGTGDDERLIDGIKPKYWDRFLLHYNFPGYSVGEPGGRPGPGRREIGHGALAKRALVPVMPEAADWPYTIRIVSDIMESNGSSSMATVCGGSLSMMAAGVPLKAPVAGIAMGLVMAADGRYAILTDILGDEDHYGDMDFKVCGTAEGITALQMDIKIDGLSAELMAEALEQARQGRLHILDVMKEHIETHRDELSPYAPRIVQVQIDPEFIGKIIGKGGETIRRIQDESGASVNVDDDGVITLASPDLASIEKAKGWISDLTEMPEAGKTYHGRVVSIKDFGAFVEFLPSTEGLVHISEWDWKHVPSLEGLVKPGEELDVKLLEVDPRTGKFRLSRKALLEKPEGWVEEERPRRDDRRGGRDERGGRSGRGGRDERGGRGRRDDRGRGRRDDRDDRRDRGRRRDDDRPGDGAGQPGNDD